MTANERRAEIIRILTYRRSETMGQLALELGVTDRTIRNDITVLTADYPLDTVRGNGGCVKMADWYHHHKNIFSREQETVIADLIDKVDEPHKRKVLTDMLVTFGSLAIRKKYLKEVKNL